MLKEGAEAINPDHSDAAYDKPVPKQPTQLREYSDEDDDEGIVKEAAVSSFALQKFV